HAGPVRRQFSGRRSDPQRQRGVAGDRRLASRAPARATVTYAALGPRLTTKNLHRSGGILPRGLRAGLFGLSDDERGWAARAGLLGHRCADGERASMTEEEWLVSTAPIAMLRQLRHKVGLRKLRLFSCACCQRIGNLIPEPWRYAVELSERYAE